MTRQSEEARPDESQRALNIDQAQQAHLADRLKHAEELAAACALDEHDLLVQLRDAGFHVTSVWDFVAEGGAPIGAVPLLVRHLSVEHHERIWEGIVRVLSVQHARAHALGPLTRLYRAEGGGDRRRRALLAHAIGSMATLDEVADLPEIEIYRAAFRA